MSSLSAGSTVKRDRESIKSQKPARYAWLIANWWSSALEIPADVGIAWALMIAQARLNAGSLRTFLRPSTLSWLPNQYWSGIGTEIAAFTGRFFGVAIYFYCYFKAEAILASARAWSCEALAARICRSSSAFFCKKSSFICCSLIFSSVSPEELPPCSGACPCSWA